MIRKLNNRRGGFTLVEIMIVVAIIALLATIAVPNFLRARKRSQATAVLEEVRVIDGAKDQWAIENNKPGNSAPRMSDLAPYFKAGTRLANLSSTSTTVVDLLGSDSIAINAVDAPPQISANTRDEFSNVIPVAASFWGSFAP